MKKKEIKTEIMIKATPERVWTILNDSDEYPNWNPLITSIKGDVEPGNKITVTIGPENKEFKPTVTKKIKDKELSLKGKLLFKILLNMEHKFELYMNDDSTTKFIQSVKIKGLLASRANEEKIANGFIGMNKALKEFVEEKKE